MNLLVTGGAGYIGSHVVRQLTEAGHSVRVYDNLSTGSVEALINKEELTIANLENEAALDRVFRDRKFDGVLHFAASIIVPESVADPLKYYTNNTVNTTRLIAACVRHGVERFIFSSTAAVYGSPESGIASEETPTAPMNPYGKSKLMSEWIIKDACAVHGMNYVVLRYFNVAGADPQGRMGQRTPDATHLIKVCCLAALGLREQVDIFGTDFPTADGTGVRDYIHVEDLASAHLAALDYLAAGGESATMNAGYGHGSSVLEVVESVRRASGVHFEAVAGPRRAGDPAIVIANSDKIKKVLCWSPAHDNLDAIVGDSFRWEKKMIALRSA